MDVHACVCVCVCGGVYKLEHSAAKLMVVSFRSSRGTLLSKDKQIQSGGGGGGMTGKAFWDISQTIIMLFIQMDFLTLFASFLCDRRWYICEGGFWREGGETEKERSIPEDITTHTHRLSLNAPLSTVNHYRKI